LLSHGVNNMPITGAPDFFTKAIWVLLTILILLIIYYLVNIGNRFVSDQKELKINNKRILLVLGSLVLIYGLYRFFNKYEFISSIFITVLVAIIIAYALNPVINFLEDEGINRLQGVLIVYLSILGIIFILAFLVIPKSGKEIKRLITDLPHYFEELSKLVDSMYTKYYSAMGGLPPMFQGVETVIMDNIIKLENFITEGLEGFVNGLINMASRVVSIILVPILSLYLLVDKDYFKKKIINAIPKRHRHDILYLANSIDGALSKFIKGRLIMSLYVGVATTILLLILNVEFAIVIGFITGLFDIVPYVGPFIGFLPAVFFAFLSNPIKALWVAIIFVLIQWTENNIVAPKIIGENMGMHPMVILLSIIIGGGIFGVFGMIISVPLVAIARIIFIYILEKRNIPR